MLLAYARFLGFQYSRAGCGGEAVRRIAAFPPHPLRTRFSKEQSKGQGLASANPHSVLDCPMMLYHCAKALARESSGLFDACFGFQ